MTIGTCAEGCMLGGRQACAEEGTKEAQCTGVCGAQQHMMKMPGKGSKEGRGGEHMEERRERMRQVLYGVEEPSSCLFLQAM